MSLQAGHLGDHSTGQLCLPQPPARTATTGQYSRDCSVHSRITAAPIIVLVKLLGGKMCGQLTRLEHAPFGDDTGNELGRCHVEGGIVDRHT